MEDKMKKTILILNGEYLPGYKGGGPIQSCVNLVENLCDTFDFKVICSDRDTGDSCPYSNVYINEWNKVGNASVIYTDKKMHSIFGLYKLLNNTEYDILYLNGYFSPIYTFRVLLLMSMGLVKKKNVVLQPRGDFTGGCSNKIIKKSIYISVLKLSRVCDGFTWQATSKIEEEDIKKIYPCVRPYVIPNLPARFSINTHIIEKKIGQLRLVFISRIFPKKNLKYALQVLKKIDKDNIVFDIYGPLEDEVYWGECERLINSMPNNITVSYKGLLNHEKVGETFSQYHAFLFPTLGENYGHVIAEAMMNNCLCILSKGVTPWDDYCDAVGLGGNLSNMKEFEDSILKLIKMCNDEFKNAVGITQSYISQKNENESTKNEYIKMFNKILNGENG